MLPLCIENTMFHVKHVNVLRVQREWVLHWLGQGKCKTWKFAGSFITLHKPFLPLYIQKFPYSFLSTELYPYGWVSILPCSRGKRVIKSSLISICEHHTLLFCGKICQSMRIVLLFDVVMLGTKNYSTSTTLYHLWKHGTVFSMFHVKHQK